MSAPRQRLRPAMPPAAWSTVPSPPTSAGRRSRRPRSRSDREGPRARSRSTTRAPDATRPITPALHEGATRACESSDAANPPTSSRLAKRPHPFPQPSPLRSRAQRRSLSRARSPAEMRHPLAPSPETTPYVATRSGRAATAVIQADIGLTVAFTNHQSHRDIRPVKLRQRASGGCWRTLEGLADFAGAVVPVDCCQWGAGQAGGAAPAVHHRAVAAASPHP